MEKLSSYLIRIPYHDSDRNFLDFNKGTTFKDLVDEILIAEKDYFTQCNMVTPINISFSFMDKEEYNKIEEKWK